MIQTQINQHGSTGYGKEDNMTNIHNVKYDRLGRVRLEMKIKGSEMNLELE